MAITEVNKNITMADKVAEPVTPLVRNTDSQEIGRGRSGVVYRTKNSIGQTLACKIFDSRGLTKVVQWITLGAPNPYMWNADAVQCAKIRRDILSLLVPIWTNGEVTVAGAEAAIWNDEFATFELQTRFVPGRAAALHHALRDGVNDEAAVLWRRILPNLRTHLKRAGFDGLLWQAGLGNPVALNNFLYERVDQTQHADPGRSDDGRWVWIDLESGVPALFPISPKVLVRYSLAHWWRSGRPLFDDVDMDRLKNYLRSNAEELRSALGDRGYETVKLKAEHLGEHQYKWKSLGRLHSAIQYRLMQGDIDEVEAEYYLNHQLRWIVKEIRRGIRSSLHTFWRLLVSAYKRLQRIDVLNIARKGWRFLVSQKYREEFVHKYLDGTIESWTRRGQMSDRHAQILRGQIGSPESSVYIADFGIHIAIKPAVKAIQYLLLPSLFALGILSATTVALLILTGGAIGRTTYTMGRLIQSATRGYEYPWVALWVGFLPALGNLAYPSQLLYSIRGEDEKLARFMLDDGFTRIGRHFPIWGGADTWTEHVLNRLPGKSLEFWAIQTGRLGALSETVKTRFFRSL